MTVVAFPIKSTGLFSLAIGRDATAVAWLALSRQETRPRRGPRQVRGARAVAAGRFPPTRQSDVPTAVPRT